MSDPAAALIRPLRSHEEFLACVALQREIWGRDFNEVVCPSILKVTQRIGGVAAGAFDRDGRLLGFVFGMTGVEGGRLVHWSDLLAVREEARNLGIGRRLKEFQRESVARLGVGAIYWTFDPLVARNAHLNINRLGVRVLEYVTDMYGETESELHRGLGTDRLVVVWPVAPTEPAAARTEGTPAGVSAAWHDAPIVNAGTGEGALPPPERFAAKAPPALRVEIPLDIRKVQAASLSQAAHWRAATRPAFLWCLEHGYRIAGFYRDEAAERGYYLLAGGGGGGGTGRAGGEAP